MSTVRTGPKISSRAIFMSLVASANNVGWTYQPRSQGLSVPPIDHSRTLVDAGLDVSLHPLLLALRHEGPDIGGVIGGIADLQARHHLGEGVDDLVVFALAHQNPGLRDARLPVVHQAGRLQMLDGVADVGVVEDDRRRFAAQFEADALELFTAQRGDMPTRRRRTGERDLVDTGMAHQGSRRSLCRPARSTPRPPAGRSPPASRPTTWRPRVFRARA